MNPHEKLLMEICGIKPRTRKQKIARFVGTVIGFLLTMVLFSYSFIYAFSLTLPQGLVISWVLILLLDAIKSGERK